MRPLYETIITLHLTFENSNLEHILREIRDSITILNYTPRRLEGFPDNLGVERRRILVTQDKDGRLYYMVGDSEKYFYPSRVSQTFTANEVNILKNESR